KNGRKVAVYGDYDVDGVCASAIILEALQMAGIACTAYIPDRHQEGYGLNIPAVQRVAKECKVLLTVDCGITSVEETAAAKESGMQVIITDHHRPPEKLPDADALISPLLGDYPFPYLCGAGVAYKVALGLVGERAKGLMELAALATVADMVPLLGENRAIVALGLEMLSDTIRPGLRAMMNGAGIDGKVTSEQVAFQIAPRMNACGRLDSARIALDMLLTHDVQEGARLAVRMEELNQQRKQQENTVIDEAMAQVEKMNLLERRALVVMGDGWNSGVVGLAAGKIAEKYACPTVALSREGDVCVGSARSAGDVDIHKALSQCADLFIRFGGHKQAAGLTIERSRVEEFANRLSKAVADQTGDRALIPTVICDGKMMLSHVTEETVAMLDMLQPFGMGNPPPRFLCDGALALSLRPVGNQGKHLKCTFQQGNTLRDGIFFGGGQWAGQQGIFNLVMTPIVNTFRGVTTAECQLHAMELQPEGLRKNPLSEATALLSEDITGIRAGYTISADQIASLMDGNQGTLLVCRCLETAMEMYKRFPDADFAQGSALSPQAFHTILLYGRAKDTCTSYQHVVLCDGSLGEEEAYKKACPRAQIHSLPLSAPMKNLLADMYVELSGMRECYRKLKEAIPSSLQQYAEKCGLTEMQAAFSLKVFNDIQLTDASILPFRVALLPLKKASPADSPLYRIAQQAKEEKYGVHGV
ncbi:MAG: single-stranded-DNA-specific exonuclease RecJ, partial [Clostridiales bacterium]|nr:single-stranded-DNA-specific exonuclease RecJ [Clostridiales bacterium]